MAFDGFTRQVYREIKLFKTKEGVPQLVVCMSAMRSTLAEHAEALTEQANKSKELRILKDMKT